MSHTYWRLTFTYTGYTKLAEIEMRASRGGADQCSGGTPSASTTYAGNVAANAFDNNTGTYWESGASSGPHWVQYQFAAPVDVQEVMVRAGNEFSEHYSQVKLSYSDDGSSWTDVQSWAAAGWGNGREERYLVGGTKTYWRLNITAASGGANPFYIQIAEVEMRLVAAGADQCSGGISSANGVFSGSSSDNAFDDNPATDWSSTIGNPRILVYHFDDDKEIVEYTIRASSDGSYADLYSPKDWTFEYSGDGLTWTAADTRTDEDGWSSGEMRTFSVGAAAQARRRPVYVIAG